MTSTMTRRTASIADPASATRHARYWVDLRRSYAPAILILSISYGMLLAFDWSGRAPGIALPMSDVPSALSALAFLPVLTVLVLVWYRLGRRRPWPVAWAQLRRNLLSAPAIISLVIALLLVRTLMVSAVAWKYGIPSLTSFRFDSLFHRIDHLVFAREPWWYVRALLRRPWVQALDTCYAWWFVLFGLINIREGWQRPGPRQARYFTAMALLWVLGSLTAVLLPSAGPVYYGAVTGDPAPYAALHTALARQPLLATALQRDLWFAYAHRTGGLIAGIAAFPSLHVAVPVLYVAVARNRIERAGAVLIVALTWAGSVVLGWHYAVDGLGGILLALVAWAIAARITRSPPRSAAGCRSGR